MNKPSLFVGSSSEGLEFARAVRQALAADAEVTVWNEGFFALGQTFIEALVNGLPRFDFAALVLTPDDFVESRDRDGLGPRDNVLFELGLFIGGLGRSRTFVLHQSKDLKIPSDLAGVVTGVFDWPRHDHSHLAAVGAACDAVRQAIRDLGIVETKTAKTLQDLRTRQDEHGQELSRQHAEIRSLQVALQGMVSRYEFDKLIGLERDQPFMCYYSDDLYNELKRLRALGLVGNHGGTGLTNIRRDYKDRNQEFDLRRFFFITEQGREYLELRRRLAQEE